MGLKPDDIDELKNLEESLWRPETRYDLSYQEKIFAEDCFEFGRSGRKYSRKDLIIAAPQELRAKLPLREFMVHELDSNHVFVTYTSEVQNDSLERANRCSIWTRTPAGWKLRFHQGTPLD